MEIEKNERILIESLTWKPRRGEVWLIIGPNGGGKSFLADALSGAAAVDGRRLPQAEKTAVVSLEAASALIEEERKTTTLILSKAALTSAAPFTVSSAAKRQSPIGRSGLSPCLDWNR